MPEHPAYAALLDAQESPLPAAWRDRLPHLLASAFDPARDGRWPAWMEVLEQLPRLTAAHCDFSGDVVTIGRPDRVEPDVRSDIESSLRALHPWRKGPFSIFGVTIDAEWRSNRKWRRLESHLASLQGRTVLDVGCGNGYYAWRMLGRGARLVVGIDPGLLPVVQFLAIRHFAGDQPVYVLPAGIEDVPPDSGFFDTVFSMGVLYHRRSPIDHLLELRGCLRSGGELVLETLIIDGEVGQTLLPNDRYAQMRNVWFIPSIPALECWLKRCGYRHVRVIDVSATTVEEQRTTSWMRFQSLADFLDPQNPARTIEGWPAPHRGILLAEAP